MEGPESANGKGHCMGASADPSSVQKVQGDSVVLEADSVGKVSDALIANIKLSSNLFKYNQHKEV